MGAEFREVLKNNRSELGLIQPWSRVGWLVSRASTAAHMTDTSTSTAPDAAAGLNRDRYLVVGMQR